MTVVPIKLNGRDLKPHKSTRSPELGMRTVLTNSPWEYVALWLQRRGQTNASFYWKQAHAFSKVAGSLPVESAPLLHYYTFLNAAKALIVAKGLPLVEGHGLQSHNMLGPNAAIDLNNEGVRVKNKGVFVALSHHLQDAETARDRSMRDLLFNIPCIHRTFCITYPGQQEMFIPVMDCRYVVNDETMRAYLIGRLSADFDAPGHLSSLPATFVPTANDGPSRTFRSAEDVPVSATTPTDADIQQLALLNDRLRRSLHYIAGSQTLWYIKTNVSGANRLERSPLTLTLAAMHRLSELSRYHPMELNTFFSGPENWLLNEFIQMSPPQFIDEITAQITGEQCMTPNVRPAT